MLYEIQDKISVVQAKAQEAEYPSEAYSYYDKQYGRLVAQHSTAQYSVGGVKWRVKGAL